VDDVSDSSSVRTTRRAARTSTPPRSFDSKRTLTRPNPVDAPWSRQPCAECEGEQQVDGTGDGSLDTGQAGGVVQRQSAGEVIVQAQARQAPRMTRAGHGLPRFVPDEMLE
jgi:hypothetical protein